MKKPAKKTFATPKPKDPTRDLPSPVLANENLLINPNADPKRTTYSGKTNARGVVPTTGSPALVQFYGTEVRITGDVLRLLGNFNPKYVGTDTRWMMRYDPDVAFALAVLRAPLVNLEWSIESNDPLIKTFTEWALKRVYRNLATALSNAVHFGRQMCDAVWESLLLDMDVQDPTGPSASQHFATAWAPQRFKAIDPRTYFFLIDRAVDDWVGVQQLYMRYGQSWLDPVPREKLVFWCFRREEVFGKLEGFPMADQAYEPWWFKTARLLIANRYFERKADPSVKARAGEKVIVGGKEVDGFSYMSSQALGIRSGGAVILPGAKTKDGKDYLFELEYLHDDKRGELMQAGIDALSTQIMRAYWVTDRAGTSGRGGQSSRGGLAESRQHAELMAESQESIIDELVEEVVQTQVIDRIVKYNFGEDALRNSRTRIVTAGVSSGIQDIYKDVLDNLFKAEMAIAEGKELSVAELIDKPAMLAALQVPLRPGDELDDLRAEKAKAHEAAQANGLGTPQPSNPGDTPALDPHLEAAVRDRLKRTGSLPDSDISVQNQSRTQLARNGHGDRRIAEHLGEIRTKLEAQATALSKMELSEERDGPALEEIRTKLAAVNDLALSIAAKIAAPATALAQAPAVPGPVTHETHVHIEKGAIEHHAGDIHVAAPTITQGDVNVEIKGGEKKIEIKDASGKTTGSATVKPKEGA